MVLTTVLAVGSAGCRAGATSRRRTPGAGVGRPRAERGLDADGAGTSRRPRGRRQHGPRRAVRRRRRLRVPPCRERLRRRRQRGRRELRGPHPVPRPDAASWSPATDTWTSLPALEGVVDTYATGPALEPFLGPDGVEPRWPGTALPMATGDDGRWVGRTFVVAGWLTGNPSREERKPVAVASFDADTGRGPSTRGRSRTPTRWTWSACGPATGSSRSSRPSGRGARTGGPVGGW